MQNLREKRMKWGFVLALGCCLVAAPGLCAQTGGNAKSTQKPAAQSAPADTANQFPGDTSNVPVLPTTLTPDIPAPSEDEAASRFNLPAEDVDPVASPDAPETDGSVSALDQVSSSNVHSLDSLLPQPDSDDAGKKGKHRDGLVDGPPKETSKEDITVGKYYLDNKNWRAALSRFQSALVLAPEEPEVYWGLAESERHLGQFGAARAHYLKVIEYDPDSRRAKDAKKALEDPAIANAKATAAAQ
jgi:tetratricopeptide (TPR) repeat protein